MVLVVWFNVGQIFQIDSKKKEYVTFPPAKKKGKVQQELSQSWVSLNEQQGAEKTEAGLVTKEALKIEDT